MNRTVWTRLLIGSVAALAVGTPLALAAAQSSSSPDVASSEVTSGELGETAEELASLRARPGFGSMSVDKESGTLTIRWKDPTPADVRDLAGPRPNGVEVIIRAATYSDHELEQAADTLLDKAKQEGWPVYAVGMDADTEGLTVDIGPAAGTDQAEELQARVSGLVAIPVSFNHDTDAGIPRPYKYN